jgi:hypothetical protein
MQMSSIALDFAHEAGDEMLMIGAVEDAGGGVRKNVPTSSWRPSTRDVLVAE